MKVIPGSDAIVTSRGTGRSGRRSAEKPPPTCSQRWSGGNPKSSRPTRCSLSVCRRDSGSGVTPARPRRASVSMARAEFQAPG